MHNNLTSTVFVFINSAVLFGLLWYVYRKKLVPSVYEKMEEQEQELFLLSQEKERLGQEQVALDEQVEQQERLYGELMRHMTAWRAYDSRDEQTHEQERERIAHSLHDKELRRTRYRAMQYTIKKVLPNALAQARASLEQQYANEARGQQFLQEVLHTMKESKS